MLSELSESHDVENESGASSNDVLQLELDLTSGESDRCRKACYVSNSTSRQCIQVKSKSDVDAGLNVLTIIDNNKSYVFDFINLIKMLIYLN